MTVPSFGCNLRGCRDGHQECTAGISMGLALQQPHSSPPVSTTQETHVGVQEGPMFLSILLFSCDAGFVLEIWVAKQEGSWS